MDPAFLNSDRLRQEVRSLRDENRALRCHRDLTRVKLDRMEEKVAFLEAHLREPMEDDPETADIYRRLQNETKMADDLASADAVNKSRIANLSSRLQETEQRLAAELRDKEALSAQLRSA